ncbi:hypothetical protein ACLOJK_027425, partial [Asimina triloba]
MTPKKVTRATLNLEVGEEQLILPQQGEGGPLPPQESPENIIVDVPDMPPAGPLEALSQHVPAADGPVIRAELHALAGMMRAL